MLELVLAVGERAVLGAAFIGALVFLRRAFAARRFRNALERRGK